jgi:hypothetical protein
MLKRESLQRLFGYGVLGLLSSLGVLLLLYYSSPYTLTRGVSPFEHVASGFFCATMFPIGSFAGGAILGSPRSNWKFALMGGPMGFIFALPIALFGINPNVCSQSWFTISNSPAILLLLSPAPGARAILESRRRDREGG